MIKLTLIQKPLELTEELEQQLVSEFKAKGTSVWKKTYIENALLKMSHGKCAYSEQYVNQKSSYMEIDHFKYKNTYKDEVVRWGNLLPSCKKCNDTKHDHDVMKEPIVNPLVDEPKDYMYVKAFRFYKRDEKGKMTIETLALNDRLHFVDPRSRMGFDIADHLDTLFDKLKNDGTPRKRRNTLSKIKSTLESCGPEYEYSAVVSTYILYEFDTYNEMEQYLRNEGLWDSELDKIKLKLQSIAMPQ